ncbi:MAG: methyltransferase [Flavobacteriales bacterium]|nr:methyltransferase [Flavobacteriales bacterium]MBP9080217.1 methyltransferase [Flavobacteriales bacterium]
MPNAYFRFKQFTVHQDRCALKVGTDGVLLGAWTRYAGVRGILDIGTGTGVVALIAAQRCPEAVVHAVELDRASALQARENAQASPWHGRITVHQADIRTWPPASGIDLVLCNPPFYKGHSVSKNDRMATAKHEGPLSMEALFAAVEHCLAQVGRLSMVWPLDRWNDVLAVAAAHGFFPARGCAVCYRAGKAPKRMLVEFARNGNHAAWEQLTVQDADGRFTPEYRTLLGDLELHF